MSRSRVQTRDLRQSQSKQNNLSSFNSILYGGEDVFLSIDPYAAINRSDSQDSFHSIEDEENLQGGVIEKKLTIAQITATKDLDGEQQPTNNQTEPIIEMGVIDSKRSESVSSIRSNSNSKVGFVEQTADLTPPQLQVKRKVSIQQQVNFNNRIYAQRRSELSRNKGHFKKIDEFSFNLTALMLIQMKKNKRTVKYLYINLTLDVIARLNFIYFIFIAAINDTSAWPTLIPFLYAPRILHILTQLKLLFMDQYDVYNRPLLRLSHLFRENFIVEDIPNRQDVRPWRLRGQYKEILNTRSLLFIILPVEISFMPLPTNTSHQKNVATQTFILSCYMLKGIEAILFEPVLLLLLTLHFYDFRQNQDSPDLYKEIILYILIFDIAKYIIVSTIFLIIGNKQRGSRKVARIQRNLLK